MTRTAVFSDEIPCVAYLRGECPFRIALFSKRDPRIAHEQVFPNNHSHICRAFPGTGRGGILLFHRQSRNEAGLVDRVRTLGARAGGFVH